jgi:glycosyltransferase involved in cell wall biosynthesis
MNRSDRSIKLAQIVYALCLGGSEVLAWRLARSLNTTGHYACSLYGIARGGPLAELLMADGIPSYAYHRRGGIDVRLIGRLAWHLHRNGVQVVHTHHLGQLLCGGLAAKLAGAKLVHTEHESHSLMKPRTQSLFRILSRFADHITTVSDPVTRFLRDQIGIPSRKLQTIPNGVLVEVFRDAQGLTRERWCWSKEDVVIGCVARLEAEKGHAILLTAFHRLQRRYPRARLLIVGDGSLGPALRAQAAALGIDGAVQFLGARDDIPALLATCDVFVLPSLKEGVPLSILEAMSAGKAVVASAVGSIPHIVSHGETGLLVPPGDAQALEHALASLVEEDPARTHLGQRGQAFVSEHYHFHRTVRAYRQVYEQGLPTGGYTIDDAVARSSALR